MTPEAGRPCPGQREYAAFWEMIGGGFPSLKGAASTAYYFECERLLVERFFPPLPGRSLFKTDLWDEAKNTEILRWAAQQGARPSGIDLSEQIVREARLVLAPHRPWLAVADVRAIPFASESFDLVYSMGTIEHFPEYIDALREIFRVLRPGGTAIIGVPNKADPFLRPLMVDLLNRVGLYAYGREKSFTRGELRRLSKSVGFIVKSESGVLFMPGWIRMADLFFYSRCSRFARVTAALVHPFRWLYRHVPAVRRHGYLIAVVATRPRDSGT